MADKLSLEWTKLILTTLGGIIVFGGGLYQYVSTSSHTARQPFLEKQTELCFQASEQAARLATTGDPKQWKKSWDEFWMLYWGPLAIVEDVPAGSTIYAEVAPSMVAFGNKIKSIGDTPTTLPVGGHGDTSTAAGDTSTAAGTHELTGLAINISKACQRLVTSWWATGIPAWFKQQ
jgi:hypothetical protein